MQRLCALLATWVICAHMSRLLGDAPYAALVGPPHTTRRNHARCDGVILPARHAGAQLSTPKAGSSSEDQLWCEGSQAEIPAADGQGQMRTGLLEERKWQHVPDRPGDLHCQRRVLPAGCVPGATDGSMPVGSAATKSRIKCIQYILFYFYFSSDIALWLTHHIPLTLFVITPPLPDVDGLSLNGTEQIVVCSLAHHR